MAGPDTVRGVVENLVRSLCQHPAAASVVAQPFAGGTVMVAHATVANAAFLRTGDLFTSLRFVTQALGQRQAAGNCDFGVAQPGDAQLTVAARSAAPVGREGVHAPTATAKATIPKATTSITGKKATRKKASPRAPKNPPKRQYKR